MMNCFLSMQETATNVIRFSHLPACSMCGVCAGRSFAVWDVVRDDEFSPLKNADGAAKDTPTTCREALYSLNRRYAENAGAMFVREVGAPYSGSSR